MVAGIAITVKVRKQLLEDSPTSAQRTLFYIIVHCSTCSTFPPNALPSHRSLTLEMEGPSLPHYPFLNLPTLQHRNSYSEWHPHSSFPEFHLTNLLSKSGATLFPLPREPNVIEATKGQYWAYNVKCFKVIFSLHHREGSYLGRKVYFTAGLQAKAVVSGKVSNIPLPRL